MKQFLTLLLASVTVLSIACGNEYGTNLETGRRIYSRYFYLSDRMWSHDTVRTKARIAELSTEIDHGHDSFHNYSDLAYNLMVIGEVDSSLKILENLANQYPTEYNINANLGTAYELKGNIDSALKYIQKGYKINPGSHHGSEWVHVKILEAKKLAGNDRAWYERNEILPQDTLLKYWHSDTRRSTAMLYDIHYQLRTRVKFTPPPNSVIANILESTGDFCRVKDSYENTLLSYAYALKFSKSHRVRSRVRSKIKEINERRIEKGHIDELPYEFRRMLELSQIDPRVLVEALGGFANVLDSVDIRHASLKDSLELLQTNLDSLSAKNEEQKLELTHYKTAQTKPWQTVLVVAVIVVLLVSVFIIGRKSRRS